MRTSWLSFIVVACTTGIGTSALALPPAQQQGYLNGLAPEARAAVQAELDACPSCQLEPLEDGSPNIVVPSAEPDASVAYEVAPFWLAEFAQGNQPTCGESVKDLSKQAVHEKVLGNQNVGVGFRTQSMSSATAIGTSGGPRPMRAPVRRYQGKGLQAVSGKLLGFSFDLARAEAEAVGEPSSQSLRSTVLVRSLSTGQLQTVGTKTSSAGGAVTLPAIATERTFAERSQVFTVGPFPVRLHGAVRGYHRENANGRTSAKEAFVVSNYNTGMYIDGQASLEALVAAVGADVQLTLLSGGTPTSAGMSSASGALLWDLKSDLTANALDGWLKVWARVGYRWFSKTWKHTVAEWGGFDWSHNLFHVKDKIAGCSSVVADSGTVFAP